MQERLIGYSNGGIISQGVLNGVINPFGDQTAAELVRGIRSSENSGAPIFLLTGKISTGEASEDEIAHIVSHYNARCEEKPVRLPILFAEVARELKITLPAAAAAN